MIYHCTRDNNACEKRDTCERYVTINEDCQTTLFKVACTEENNYILYVETNNNIKESK